MRQLLTRNLGWKLLSLLIAIALWIAVAREPEVATSLSVPVDFRNMRDDLDIDGNLPDRVRLEVRGPSGRLTRDNLSAVAVVLDLSDAPRASAPTASAAAISIFLPAWFFIALFLRKSLCILTNSSSRRNPSSRYT